MSQQLGEAPLALEPVQMLKEWVQQFITTIDEIYAALPTAQKGLELYKERALPILVSIQTLECNVRFRSIRKDNELLVELAPEQSLAKREAFNKYTGKVKSH